MFLGISVIYVLCLIEGAVAETESLFSYSLGGDSYADFQHPNHQPVFLDQFSPTAEQMEACGSDQQCVYDYAQTGNIDIGLSTMKIEQSNSMDQVLLGMLKSVSQQYYIAVV